jgi:hypothetical protein
MAMGKTPVVTGCTGYLDYVSDETGWLVRLPARAGLRGDGHVRGPVCGTESWSDADVPHLRRCMREAYADSGPAGGEGRQRNRAGLRLLLRGRRRTLLKEALQHDVKNTTNTGRTSVTSDVPRLREASGRQCKRVKPLTRNHRVPRRRNRRGQGVVVCTGPWGTGKTFMACGKAVELLGTARSSGSSSPGRSRSAATRWAPARRPVGEGCRHDGPALESLEEFLEPGELDADAADEPAWSSHPPRRRCGGGP